MKRKPRTSYVLYTRLSRLWGPRVMLSMPSVGRPAEGFNKNADDMVIRTFTTQRQCEDFINTAYHQRKDWREL